MTQPDDNSEELELLKEKPNKFPYNPDQINIDIWRPTVYQLLKRIQQSIVDLQPEFQRSSEIWDIETQSRLIESILIRIPLPTFYIDTTDERKWLIVDGLQRLTAINNFCNQELTLKGLEYLTELNDKRYDDLDVTYQNRIEDTEITVCRIKTGTPPEVKYNIFKRLNTMGEPLTPQEIRHALYIGKGTRLLSKLSESSEFKTVIQLGDNRRKRMDDREFILGFLAYFLLSYEKKKDKSRDNFLIEGLKKLNDLTNEDISQLESTFKKTMIIAWKIFEDQCFRKISRKPSPKSQQEKVRKFPVNKALFETWSFHLSRLTAEESDKLIERKEKLKDLFISKIDNDSDFLDSISQADTKIDIRFDTIKQIIEETLQ